MKSDLQAKKEVIKSVKKPKKTAVLAVPPKPTKAKVTKKIQTASVAVVPKKQTPKKPSRLSDKKKPPASTTLIKTTKENTTVTIPSTASLRLLEKVELYTLWYQNKFPTQIARVAKVGGYCFILLGTMLSVYGYFTSAELSKLPAASICSQSDCVEIDDSNLAPTAPLVTFLNSLPSEITKDTDITVRSRNGQEPALYIKAMQSGVTTTLVPNEKLADGEYRYLIETAKIGSGFFEVKAKLADSEKMYTFNGPTFVIGGISYSKPKEEKPVVSLDTASSTATSSADIATLDTEEEQEEEFIATDYPITLTIEEASDSEFAKIKTGTYLPEAVTLKARIAGTSPTITLGAATKIQSEWIFSLSALNLPYANYEIFADFKTQGRDYQTPTITFTPKVSDVVRLSTDDDVSLLVGKINLALETSEVQNLTRRSYFTHIASTTPNFFDRAHEASFTTEAVSEAVDDIMFERQEMINNLLFTHALISSNDSKYLADYSIESNNELAKSIARNFATTKNTSGAESVIKGRFEALRNRVNETEDRIAEDSRSLTETDTDSDGLSDYDELANTNTDPAKSDSDNDSVLDGIEIVDFTNPTVADLQRFPDQNSLKINTSETPITLRSVRAISQNNGEIAKTYPLIEGVTIPNSYVYIFVSGIDTPGIIRAGVDGRFEYTFEQELSDGTYEAKASLINTAGEIIAETRPLVFTKRDDRLVAAAMFSDQFVMGDLSDDSNIPYVVAASILIVTFGFILILLSQSLLVRRRELGIKH